VITLDNNLKNKKPNIIQGGLGVAVSGWELARAVSKLGEIGVISGICLDNVMIRELQNGDPDGRLEALSHYPDQEIVEHIKEKFYVEEGISPDQPYKVLPTHGVDPEPRLQRILSAAVFSEVYLAKEGHDGVVGMNLLSKLKRYTLACLYGAMLADVDLIIMGAGIPVEEANQISNLAAGKPARLTLEIDKSLCSNPRNQYFYKLDPADILPAPPELPCPDFFPIVSTDTLARILDHKISADVISGFVVEKPVAGGHNAPPRNKQYDDDGNPIYDDRDQARMEKMQELGYPFYLAGGYGSPEKLKQAHAVGAEGIQVGSLFSLADESNYPPECKKKLIREIHRDNVAVRTDGRISPTGFPFKVVELEGTLGIPENMEKRRRVCELGYLQQIYLDKDCEIKRRCPSEPIQSYLAKGGDKEETEGRGCLCNALFANIGLAQRRPWGNEGEIFTAGDEIVNLPLGSAKKPHYTASDVIDYLYSSTGSD